MYLVRDTFLETEGGQRVASMTPDNRRRSTRERRIVVIGTGNPCRGDDAVGVAFSRRIRRSVPDGVTVLELDGEAASLIDAWTGADAVILVDGVRTGHPGGTTPRRDTLRPRDGSRKVATGGPGETARVYRFEAHRNPLPAELFRFSTHAMGVAEAVELTRALGEMPPSLVIYGIRGDQFEHTTELSPEVDTACNEVVLLVLEDIRELSKRT